MQGMILKKEKEMPANKPFKGWNKVPDQSKLHVQIEGGTGTVRGILTVNEDETHDLKDKALRAGETLQLQVPDSYTLFLIMEFAKQSTMTVKAHVEKPDGDHFGQDFEKPITGGAGDVRAVGISVVTLQKAEG